LLATSAWASTTCYLTWKDKVTPAGRLLFQLAPSTPRIDGTEFGLLPTPKAMDSIAAGEGTKDDTLIKRHKSTFGLNLAEHVQMEKRGLWPTLRASAAMAEATQNQERRQYKAKLEQAVAMWPTPTTRDYKGGRKPETLKASGRGATNSLNDALTCQGQSGALNPQWVEWLMGFPDGWTDLKPSEMPLFRKSSK